ncbi:LAMI_0D06788g1_1 [Lachancea mirantina]|uniref:LAMI_0D06788g1_1 n=1 Tax=Lachancea mirantina TaxID=1230905 RepID=A0A1G4JBZ8_9SACH|nr:LAMI_0D06788g1_1 [Lachancea mirantina]
MRSTSRSSAILQFLISAVILSNFVTEAFPIRNPFKREIVTRMHTASTTHTVTDVYSTTTDLSIAPTVEFIISGDVTFTTTLPAADGSIPTGEPSITITSHVANAVPTTNCVTTLTPAGTKTIGAVQSEVVETISVSAVANTQVSPTTTSQNEQNPSPATTSQNEQNPAPTTTSPNEQNSAPTSTTQNAAPITTTPVSNEETTQAAQTTSQNPSSGQTAALKSAPTALAYSPYNNDGTCKDASSVSNDLEFIKSKGVSKIRVYGTDCNSLETVNSAASQLGIKINQGLWIDSTGVDSIDSAVSALIQYGQTNGWDVFDFITIGNEAVLSGFCSADELINKISSVTSQMKGAGYSGKFTYSDAPSTFQNNPNLCQAAIDFIGINAHAYFDVYATADSAGSFVKSQIALTQQICGTSNIMVTETGYPSSGIQNGGNDPSTANQIIAVQSILDELNSEVTILSTYNDLWKAPGPYGIEQSFGIGEFLPTV